MEKLEGGGSFTICPDTGTVTAQHVCAPEAAAPEVPVAEAANGDATESTRPASKLAKVTPIKE